MDALILEAPRLPLGEFGADCYTCCYCSRAWNHDDPGFVYWRTHNGLALDGRDGRARSSLGWFAHCADRTACERRRANRRAGVDTFQLGLPGIEPVLSRRERNVRR